MLSGQHYLPPVPPSEAGSPITNRPQLCYNPREAPRRRVVCAP